MNKGIQSIPWTTLMVENYLYWDTRCTMEWKEWNGMINGMDHLKRYLISSMRNGRGAIASSQIEGFITTSQAGSEHVAFRKNSTPM